MSYKVGVICPSEIAFRRFLPSLQRVEEFEFAGVAIASKEEFVGATDEILAKERAKAQTFVDNYGGKIYEGYQTLIESPEVDVVYLPLPPALHFKWAKKVLEAGKHAYVEKPFTTSLADTQTLISMAKEKDLAVHENYMFIFHKQLQAVNDIIASVPPAPFIGFRFNRIVDGDFSALGFQFAQKFQKDTGHHCIFTCFCEDIEND